MGTQTGTIHTDKIVKKFQKTKQTELSNEAIDALMDKYGLLAIDQDYVSPDLLEKAYDIAKQFFNLPSSVKDTCAALGRPQTNYDYVGYYKYKTETAVDAKEADLKEFIQFSRFDGLKNNAGLSFNRFAYPKEIPEMQTVIEQLYADFLECADRMMFRILDSLNIPKEQAYQLVNGCNSILRIIHYPPVTNEDVSKAQRAAPHTGINLIGLQPEQTHRGLQYSLPDGSWQWLKHDAPTHLAVNIGEMLQYISGDKYKASLHQVTNDPENAGKQSRYCVVFFKNANPRADLPSAAFDRKNVGDWITERLRTIGNITY